MNKIVLDTLHQTKKIAQRLKGATLHDTLRNIARYFKDFYAYKQDSSTREQLRTPIRAYHDRFDGCDCDCYCLSISSFLLNLGIDHHWRKTKATSQGDYTHIYVVVPKTKGLDLDVRANYYVIDPVVGDFNKEHTGNNVPPYYEDYHVTMTAEGMGSVLTFVPAFDPIKAALISTSILLFGIGIYQYTKKK